MSDNYLELNKELRGLDRDKLMTARLIDAKKNEIAESLRGEMGKDMIAVLKGERTVELEKKEKRKRKLSAFFERLFRMF